LRIRCVGYRCFMLLAGSAPGNITRQLCSTFSRDVVIPPSCALEGAAPGLVPVSNSCIRESRFAHRSPTVPAPAACSKFQLPPGPSRAPRGNTSMRPFLPRRSIIVCPATARYHPAGAPVAREPRRSLPTFERRVGQSAGWTLFRATPRWVRNAARLERRPGSVAKGDRARAAGADRSRQSDSAADARGGATNSPGPTRARHFAAQRLLVMARHVRRAQLQAA